MINAKETICSDIWDERIDVEKIRSPALKKIVRDFNDPNIITKLYDKHSDWREQGRCGCLAGCVLG